jgi:hypothetical protein
VKPINPHGSRGARVVSHFETPFEHTEEGIAAAAMRVPADKPDEKKLDAAADKLIREINGDAEKAAGVPSGTLPDPEAGDDIP